MFRPFEPCLETHAMTPTPDSPQARLAASRKALIRQMARDDGSFDDADSLHEPAADAGRGSQRSGTWQVLSQAVMAWWQHHPVQIAVDIGRPFLNNYARDKPLQLLGLAAGVGAAIVLVKPWRLVSITGLGLAALRSTKVSGTLLSLLPRTAPNQHFKKNTLP
jgi:hypothetical protein